MEFWEFLIQKDGDRSWLPIESPGAEILEGRYRIVARSHRANTGTEIRITHLAADEDPPKRRVQSRQSQTNPDGLLVVMPYTRLQPGIWELCCASDVMTEMLGEGWQHRVQLQVLPHESEAVGDWESEESSPPPLESSKPESSRTEVAPALLRLIKNGSARKPEAPRETSPLAPAAVEPCSTAAGAEQPEPLASEVPVELRAAESVELEAAQPPGQPEPEPVAFGGQGEMPLEPTESVEPAAIAPAGPPVPSEVLFLALPEVAAAAGAIAATTAVPGSLEPVLTSPPLPPSMAMAEALSQQVVDEVFQTLDLSQETPTAPPPAPLAAAQRTLPPLWLSLPQEAYTAHRGEPLHLVGQIETDPGAAVPPVPAAELSLCLRDPQSAQVLVEARQLVMLQQFPHAFAITATLPRTLQSRLLVGELTLLDRALAEPEVLATYRFTVTADVNDLLEAIAQNTTAKLYPPLEVVEQRGELDLAFVQFLNAPKPTLTFKPTNSLVLPPQLHSARTAAAGKGLELPFSPIRSTPAASTPPEMAVSAVPTDGSTAAPASPAAPAPASVVPDLADAPLDWSEALLDEPDPLPEWSDSTSTPEDVGFQSLNLKHRFWSRLNSLVGDRELTTALQQEVIVQGLDTATAASQEVVLPDEPPPPVRWGMSSFQEVRQSLLKQPETLPADQPIPMPHLEVPNRELTSGDRITVAVKIPRTPSSLYVKLWIFDPQNRVILDGPRWLMDLPPNGLGDLETWLQLEVPHGCLEMQVEAIAIEIASQRESHKASVTRAVIPPNLPALTLEELDV